jgi:hypothetical protein
MTGAPTTTSGNAKPQTVRIELITAGSEYPDRRPGQGEPFGLPLLLKASEWIFEYEKLDSEGMPSGTHRLIERHPLRAGWNEVILRCSRPIGPNHGRDVEVRVNGELMLGMVPYFGKLWTLQVATGTDSPVVLALEVTPKQ